MTFRRGSHHPNTLPAPAALIPSGQGWTTITPVSRPGRVSAVDTWCVFPPLPHAHLERVSATHQLLYNHYPICTENRVIKLKRYFRSRTTALSEEVRQKKNVLVPMDTTTIPAVVKQSMINGTRADRPLCPRHPVIRIFEKSRTIDTYIIKMYPSHLFPVQDISNTPGIYSRSGVTG